MAHCRQRVRFAASWREEFFEAPYGFKTKFRAEDIFDPAFLPRASERQVQ
jgi:hypothetical protein